MVYLGTRENNARLDQLVGPYEYLAKRRVLFLNGPIVSSHDPYSSGGYTRSDAFNGPILADVILALNEVEIAPIWLVINSSGGVISEGMILYDAIKLSLSPVYVVGRNCMSMAAVIFSAGEPGHRYTYPNASFMLHLPMGSATGDSKEVAIRSKEMDKAKEKLVNELIKNGIKLTKKKLLQEIDREKWLTADEAIEYGLADKMVEKDTIKLIMGQFVNNVSL